MPYFVRFRHDSVQRVVVQISGDRLAFKTSFPGLIVRQQLVSGQLPKNKGFDKWYKVIYHIDDHTSHASHQNGAPEGFIFCRPLHGFVVMESVILSWCSW